ncbi:hypothetical protein LSAT2_015894 [Lamellibrachia satsuma]|nr:hypothetical protein LSAT2_015894 [Lamellibrachia satsuma]
MASTLWQVTVCDALDAMRKDGTLCDTTIVGVDGTTLYAHACVLTAASPSIARYVTRTAEGRYHVDIDWISGPSWDLLLKLLYCGTVDVDRDEEIEHVRELAKSFDVGILVTTITHPQIKVHVIKSNRCSGEIDQENVQIDAYSDNDKTLDVKEEPLAFETTDCDYSSQIGATFLTDTTRLSSATETQMFYRTNANNIQSNGNPSESEYNVSANVVVPYGEAPTIYEIRTVSSPARVPLTYHPAEHVVLPAETVVRNTCNFTADVRHYPTDYANKTLELCQPLRAIDTQKKKLTIVTTKKYVNNPGVVGTRSTYFAPVYSLCSNPPPVNKSTLQEDTTKCQRMKLSCDKCSKTFSSTSGLWKHALIHKDGRSHGCSYCGKQFNRNDNMLRHQRAHSGVKPFKCSVCGKTFCHNISLARHQVIHTGDRPYSCDACGQTFSWKTSLTSHRLTHTIHKSHACALCGRAFCTKQGLRRHMTLHTDVRFSQNSNLASHRQTYTNVRPHLHKVSYVNTTYEDI